MFVQISAHINWVIIHRTFREGWEWSIAVCFSLLLVMAAPLIPFLDFLSELNNRAHRVLRGHK